MFFLPLIVVYSVFTRRAIRGNILMKFVNFSPQKKKHSCDELKILSFHHVIELI